MAENIEKSLLELDFARLTRRTFTPSPAAWEVQAQRQCQFPHPFVAGPGVGTGTVYARATSSEGDNA
jgi:hypothetical protein